jgi:cytochrome c-type biogenesis protein
LVDFGYGVALLAGALSFLSPCVLPLVPPYLCYMAGVSSESLQTGDRLAGDARRRLRGTALLFVLGFSTVFILLGVGASSIGLLLRQNLHWLGILAGLAIIAMGLNFLGILHLNILSQERRFQGGKPQSYVGSYIMGLAFAFGWTPCIGPVLGTILGLAGARQTAQEGALMLAFYSAGLGIPFLLTALFSGFILSRFQRLKAHMRRVEQAMGALLVMTGVLFLTGGMQAISFWLLETFPALQTIG